MPTIKDDTDAQQQIKNTGNLLRYDSCIQKTIDRICNKNGKKRPGEWIVW